MTERKNIYYATAFLLAVIIFASNFLNTDIFEAGYQNFSVWFILSLFSVACGWLINKTLGYAHGGKIIFSVVVSTSFLSAVMISLFSEYFGLSNLLVESLILFILRNITLGAMALFGMVLSELIQLQRDCESGKHKLEELRRLMNNAQKEAQFIVEDARMKSDKMLYDAQKTADEIIERKKQVEYRLREFIAVEKELIKKYESEED